jgi:glucose dehydrogenase
MGNLERQRRMGAWRVVAASVLGMALVAQGPAGAQGPGTRNGEWHHLGGDAWNTRYLPASQIDASNFNTLEVAWQWKGQSFGEEGPGLMRSTPSYVDGVLYNVAGERRTVVAIDPSTGATIWSFREPDTFRWAYSMRASYGKGVSYAVVDGRPVIFMITPARFLYALDARTGRPLENWGRGVDLPGFSRTGVVDVLEDQARGWGPWEALNKPWDPYQGIPLEIGYATASSPPIVVNDVVIVGTSHEQGYNQTRQENIPGDIVAYDAPTGKMKWKFHVVPREGEYGYETWETGTSHQGNIGSWAPMSADPELGLVYIPTKGGVLDYYGGFRPGDNLFGNSILALDVKTGERRWHYQMVRHDIWNYDTPTAPVLMDVTIDGRRVPVIAQPSKQSFLYVLDRRTGEPIWPVEERPVPQSKVPGEKLSPTQPFPTWPLPYDLQGRSEDHLIDYTPEIRQRALEQAQKGNHFAPLFNPPTHRGNAEGAGPARICGGGGGGSNITGPPAADPVNGVIYVSSHSGCTYVMLVPGHEVDHPKAAGTTVVDWARGPGGRPSGPPDNIDGLSIWKGPVGRITAIDLNTGKHLWVTPHGDAPQEVQDRIRNHPLLQGVDGVMTNPGRGGLPSMMVTESLVIATGMGADDEPYVFAIDKRTGKRVGQVRIPALSMYGMSGFVHNGQQHIMIQQPFGLVALRLPQKAESSRALQE